MIPHCLHAVGTIPLINNPNAWQWQTDKYNLLPVSSYYYTCLNSQKTFTTWSSLHPSVSDIHSRPAIAFRHVPPWRKNAIHQCLEFVSGLQKLPLWSLPWFHTNCHKRLKTNKTLNIFWFWHVLNHTPMTYPWDVAITINGNWNCSDWVIHTDHWAEHVLSVFLGAFLKQKWLLSKTLLLPAPAHPLALCILVLTCMKQWDV